MGRPSQFCAGVCEEMFSWMGAAVERGHETGSRGITIVKRRYQATTSEDSAGWFCEVWKSAIAL
jgi:hypothetical protein